MALRVVRGSMEDMGRSGEEEEIVFADTVDMTVDEGRVKVDEVEETGADRKESNIRLRSGYASVEGG